VGRWPHQAHLVALAFLVLFAREAVKRGAAEVLMKPRVVVRVVVEDAGQGGSAPGGAHAAESESHVFVAGREEVRGVGAEESDDHISGDAWLVSMGSAEDAGQALGEAGIGRLSLGRRGELGLPVVGDDGVHDTSECRV
jgi:hypothetical protein